MSGGVSLGSYLQLNGTSGEPIGISLLFQFPFFSSLILQS